MMVVSYSFLMKNSARFRHLSSAVFMLSLRRRSYRYCYVEWFAEDSVYSWFSNSRKLVLEVAKKRNADESTYVIVDFNS